MNDFEKMLRKPISSFTAKESTDDTTDDCADENNDNADVYSSLFNTITDDTEDSAQTDPEDDTTTGAEIVATVQPVINPADATDAFIAADLAGSEDDEDLEEEILTDMQKIAIPMLIAQESTSEEYDTFIESTDCDLAVKDAFMTERTIVRFDKYARTNQLQKIAEFSIAKARKDPDYKRLRNVVWPLEKKLEARLHQKYGTMALPIARKMLQKAKNSKSKTVRAIIKKQETK